MNEMDIICLFIFLLFIIISIAIVIVKNCYERIKVFNKNLLITKDDFNEKIFNKYDLIKKFIKSIKEKYKVDIKLFEEVNDLDENDLLSLKNEKLLNSCYKELVHIKEDNQKNKELKVFKDIISNYENNELYILSLRTYYNKHILKYNNLIKKFPYNLIAKMKKCSSLSILDGKELEEEITDNLEV